MYSSGFCSSVSTYIPAKPPTPEAFYDARRDVYYTKPALRGWLHLLWFGVSLVFGTAALGDLVDDGTLVYLWTRPQRRTSLALGAWSAALTYAVPLVVVPTLVTNQNLDLALPLSAARSLAVRRSADNLFWLWRN